MSDTAAREEILQAIRNGLAGLSAQPGQSPEPIGRSTSAVAIAEQQQRMVAQFCTRAAEENATSERVWHMDEIAGAIARYLREQKRPLELLVAGDVAADVSAGAGTAGLIMLNRGIAPDGDVVVTGCLAGIADSGAVVTMSSAENPNEWQYLAEIHIVIVRAGTIVATHDDFWPFLSAALPSGLPRALNWIVGPSRTADLGVPSRLGAHGPARVHLLIVD